MRSFSVGDRVIGSDQSTYVIAEAGSNHNGNLETAKKLIDAAAHAGADAVKFQTFRADHLYVDDRERADDSEDSAYSLLKSLEQPYEWIPELYDHCQSRGVEFMSSPFDRQSAQELSEYVSAFKVASFTLSHHPFLEHLAEYDKPIIMSTGAHEQPDVEEAVRILRQNGIEDIGLLHCVSSYPTPLEEANLRTIQTLKREFDTVVGFSDHTTNPATAPAAAVALGASIVEKHFTLDKEMDGPDHSFALEPDELSHMIDVIRNTEKTLGNGEITVLDVESETVDRARRGLFAVQDISPGETITEEAVRVLRPGDVDENGLHPKYMDDVIGSTAIETIKQSHPVSFSKINIKPE